MYAVSFIYSDSFFIISRLGFSLFKDNGLFPPLPPSKIVFSNRTYQFTYRPRVWPLVRIAVTIGNSISRLCIFTILRVAGWQWSMRRPPQTRIQNGLPFIIDCSSSGGVSHGGVFHKCSDLYTPPPPKPPQIREC